MKSCSSLLLFLSLFCFSLTAVAQEQTEAKAEKTAKPEEAKNPSDDEADGKTDSEEAANEEIDEHLEGHSLHGEVFNEGPRQAAYLMDGTGEVDFPVTTKSDEAKQFVLQGIGQLHGFWYFESERSFRQAAAIDPDCAIAYWGMAMSNRKNDERAKGFIEEAMKRRKDASKYERLWIEAFDKYAKAKNESDDEKRKRATQYVESIEKILFDFPDDVEAKAFLAEFLWTAQREKLPIVSYHAIDAMIADVLQAQPNHPIHHYRIHLWDRKKPELALESAALCGPSAPAIAHMWHMPGHIYSRLHRYHDAVYQQEASARVDHAHMQQDMVLPDQIHNFAHNNEWCIRNLLHVGRIQDALSLARNMFELPRHPKYNTAKKGSYRYGRDRLLLTLSTYQLFDEAVRLADTPYLQPIDDEKLDLKRDRLLASAYIMTGQPESAEPIRQRLQQQLEDKQKEKTDAEQEAKDKVLEEASKKEESKDAKADYKQQKKAIDQAVSKAGKEFKKGIEELQAAVDEIDGRIALMAEDFEAAEKLLSKADGVPTEEVVDVMLRAGKTKEAIKKIEGFVRTNQNEVRPLACLIEAYWRTDQKDKAKKTFRKLQKLSADLDLNVPAFAALRPVADALELPADWCRPIKVAKDLGERPALDELGPFRWAPPEASGFELVDADGQTRSLEEFDGKPVVAIFYLGHGCLHCAEQLQKFAPEAQKFKDAGIELIAISTDKQEALSRAYENLDEKFSFPLVADPELNIFKKYRCFDDFEQQTLHGTFVIDADRKIRWMDISYEPFMEPDFVLEEAVRLLEQDQVTRRSPQLTKQQLPETTATEE